MHALIAGDPPASNVVRVTYFPPEEPVGRCTGPPPLPPSSVQEMVGRSFVVFVNRSATVGLGQQITSYAADGLPERNSGRTISAVVSHACDECSKSR